MIARFPYAPAHIWRVRPPLPVALLLLISLLLSALPTAPSVPVPPEAPAAPRLQPQASGALSTDPFATTAPALLAKPELVERREEFARHYDLGDGRYLALVSPTPLNYRDDSGAWQPLDAAFAPAEGGWVVRRNSLRSALAERGTMVRLEASGSFIGWQPRALQATGAALAQPIELATPLPPEQAAPGQPEQNGTTLRYSRAWSDAALAELFHSLPGALEQELVLTQPPRAVAAAEWLELRVHLSLPPNVQLYADGAMRSGEFTTDGPLELRAPDGTPLLAFAPPAAYEQGAGGARVAGRYRVAQRADGVELSVQTPWSWWADPARRYPTVLDPTMQVIRNQDGAHILVKKNQPFASVAQYPCVGFYNDSKLGETGYVRGYTRFALPTLPNGAAPASATLVAVPDATLTQNSTYNKFQDKYGERVTRLQATAWRTPADWSNLLTTNSIPAISLPAMDVQTAPATIKQPETVSQQSYPATTWDVSGIVQGWYADPNSNHGLALTALYESKYQDSQYPDGNYRTLDCFPSAPTWSNLDSVLANPSNPTTDGPGLGLLISYTAPALQANELRRFNTVASAQPERTFRDQYHEYQLLASAPNWRLVAAQGVDGPNTPRTPLDLVGGNNDLLAQSDGGDAAPGSNLTSPLQFIVMDGHQALPTGLRVRVQPDNAPGPNHNVRTYDLQTADAQFSPAIPPPSGSNAGTASVTLALANALVRGQELSLSANTTVEIKAPYAAFGLDPSTAQLYNLQLFQPGLAMGSRSNGGANLIRGPDAYEIEFPVKQSGVALLVLSSNIGPTSLNGSAQVTVCTNSDQVVRYPLNGACVELRRPPGGFASDPAHYKTLGNLRVYSPGGFTDNGNGTFTTNENDTSGGSPVPVMPLLGYTGSDTRWVALKGGTLTLDSNTSQVTTSADTRLVLADFSSASQIVSLPVLRGQFQAGQSGVLATISPPGSTFLLVNNPLPHDTNGWQYEIKLPSGQLHGAGPLSRTIEPTPGQPVDYSFSAEWTIDANGAPALQGQVRLVSLSLSPFPIGTLLLAPPSPAANAGYGIEFNPRDALASNPPALPAFDQIRVSGATLSQPDNLGGAKVPVQALLLLRKQAVKDEQNKQVELQCAADNTCFDLRGPNDAMISGGPQIDRKYKMPDLIVQDKANTVMFNTADRLEIFSSDHPMAKLFPQAGANDTSFTYETFNASVKTFLKPCPGGRDTLDPDKQDPPGPKTTVIEGQATMTLPNLGGKDAKNDASDAPKIEVRFILCETSLRELSFTFDTGELTSIPIGSSGLFMNLIGGTISIAPQQGNQASYTTVTIKVGFRGITPQASTSIFFVRGIVTIDSRGLFDVQLHAGIKVAANIGAGVDGHFWVAWSPLDLGFMVQACVPFSGFDPKKYPGVKPDPNDPDANLCKGNELLYGMLRAHMWQGQGWQHRYPWLPDNDTLHMAARFEAKLQIPAGAIVDWGLFKLPPFSISIGIKLAFGEFCRNSNCTQYEWGIMGAVSILGFDLGIYYGFQSGVNFILGNADYKLIDEAKLLATAQAHGSAMQPLVAPETPITLAPGLSSALFGLAWSGGAPTFSLVDPNNQTITSQSVLPNLTVTTVPTTLGSQTLLAFKNPLPGTWHVKIGNVTTSTKLRFFYIANRAAPTVALSLPQNLPPGATSVPISWTSSVGVPGLARISLYYERTEPTNLSGETEEGPIVEHLPLGASGSYTWNREGLSSGIYRVYARIENNAPTLLNSCGNAPYNPDPTQQGLCGTLLNTGLVMPAAQIDAPGQLIYQDSTPPAPPQGVKARAEGASNVAVRWLPNRERDLSGYIVTCQQGAGTQRRVRVSAQLDATAGISETAQVNGLDATPATCSVQAYDASGNLSLPSAGATATPTGNIPLPPAAVTQININPQTLNNTVAINWSAVNKAQGYLLYYQPILNQQSSAQAAILAAAPPAIGPTSSYRADQGASPINVGRATSFTLSGLAGGVIYEAWVRAYDADGRLGPRNSVVRFTAPDRKLIYLPQVRR